MKICGLKTIKVLLFLSIDDMLMIHSMFLTLSMRLNYFVTFLTHNILISSSLWKKTNKIFAFLDVCSNNGDPSSLKTSTYRTKTFTGLLTNFFSFTSVSYKVGLIRTLVDRAYKINNSLLSFNNGIKKLTHILKKNQYPEYLINKVVKAYLDNNGNSAPSDHLFLKLHVIEYMLLYNHTPR